MFVENTTSTVSQCLALFMSRSFRRMSITRSSFSILKNGVKVWDTLMAFPSLGNSIAQLPDRAVCAETAIAAVAKSAVRSFFMIQTSYGLFLKAAHVYE